MAPLNNMRTATLAYNYQPWSMHSVVRQVTLSLCITAMLLVSIAANADMRMYRYKVDGKTIINGSVPPEFVHLGYEILNSKGIVIDVVPRALTKQEIAEKERLEAIAERRQQLIVEQRKKDATLLRLYTTINDINRAQARKTEEINSYIELSLRDIATAEEKLDKARADAAGYERRDKEIPANLQLELVQLEESIADSYDKIKRRRSELANLQQDFEINRQRLLVLKVYELGTLDDEVVIKNVPGLAEEIASPAIPKTMQN